MANGNNSACKTKTSDFLKFYENVRLTLIKLKSCDTIPSSITNYTHFFSRDFMLPIDYYTKVNVTWYYIFIRLQLVYLYVLYPFAAFVKYIYWAHTGACIYTYMLSYYYPVMTSKHRKRLSSGQLTSLLIIWRIPRIALIHCYIMSNLLFHWYLIIWIDWQKLRQLYKYTASSSSEKNGFFYIDRLLFELLLYLIVILVTTNLVYTDFDCHKSLTQ